MNRKERESLRRLYKEAVKCMSESSGRINAVVNPEKLMELHNNIDQTLPDLLDLCDKLEEKVLYAKEFGLVIGTLKTSDCPEGRLAHDTVEGSTLARLEGEMVRAIDLEVELEKLNNKTTAIALERNALRKQIEVISIGYCSCPKIDKGNYKCPACIAKEFIEEYPKGTILPEGFWGRACARLQKKLREAENEIERARNLVQKIVDESPAHTLHVDGAITLNKGEDNEEGN